MFKSQLSYLSKLCIIALIVSSFGLVYSQTPGTLYGTTGASSNELIIIDPTTGTGTLVAPLGLVGPVTEIEFRDDEVLFGSIGQGLSTIITIDPITGVETIVGTHPFGTVNGSDFDSGVNLLGSFFNPGVSTDLVIVDQVTGGFSSVIGPIFTSEVVTGLTFNSGGILYGVAHLTGANQPSFLYTIDPATAIPTLVGPIGFDKVGAIEFGPDGILYGGVGSGVTNAGALISIDPSTGAGTLIGPTGFLAISGLSFYPGASSDCNLFEDTFDIDIAQWTEVGGLGTANWFWGAGNQAGGAAPGELTFAWTPQFIGDSYLMSPVIPSASYTGTISFEHYLNWYGGAGTVGFAYTTDGGTSWASIWEVVDPPGSIGPENVTVPFTGDANLQIGFYWSGDSYNINFWHIDDVCVYGVVPVELTSFTASVDGRNVTLNWSTATETNNQGFEIERNSGNGFEKVDYVAGFGTSTEPHSYSFIDASLNEGTYSYRLKQLDFNGTFEYFDAIEVDIAIPDVFALAQNYPNPFNPSTKIHFSLAVDSKVSLKVFDALGQEVSILINTDLVAGAHNVDFNAASINTGVYFYRIEATGIDGTNFTQTKKMILLK